MERMNLKISEPRLVFNDNVELSAFGKYFNTRQFLNEDIADLVGEDKCILVCEPNAQSVNIVMLCGLYEVADLIAIQEDFNEYLKNI